MIRFIKKRDSRIVPFDISKIDDAIFKAAKAQGGTDRNLARRLADRVATPPTSSTCRTSWKRYS